MTQIFVILLIIEGVLLVLLLVLAARLRKTFLAAPPDGVRPVGSTTDIAETTFGRTGEDERRRHRAEVEARNLRIHQDMVTDGT